MSRRQRDAAALGQYALHLAGKGYGPDPRAGAEGRADAAARRSGGSAHQDLDRRRREGLALWTGGHVPGPHGEAVVQRGRGIGLKSLLKQTFDKSFMIFAVLADVTRTACYPVLGAAAFRDAVPRVAALV